jgi:chemotaxis signal transduction protein
LAPARRGIDILFDGQGKGNIENGLSSSAPPQEGRGGPGGDAPPSGPGYPLLLIRTGEFRAGIPVGRVREVVRLRKLSRVPDEKAPFRGLLSLRGEIVTVVDLAGLHALSRTAGAPAARQETTGVTTGAIRPTRIDSVVVLRGGHDSLGLEVDGVEDIRDFASKPEGRDPAPPPPPPASESTGMQAPAPGRMWAGIVKDERGEIGILDAEFVFELVEALAKQTEEPQALEVGDSG